MHSSVLTIDPLPPLIGALLANAGRLGPSAGQPGQRAASLPQGGGQHRSAQAAAGSPCRYTDLPCLFLRSHSSVISSCRVCQMCERVLLSLISRLFWILLEKHHCEARLSLENPGMKAGYAFMTWCMTLRLLMQTSTGAWTRPHRTQQPKGRCR